MSSRHVLITGASGNLGGKLRQALAPRYPLRLLDRTSRDDPAIVQADLAAWGDWVEAFTGIDTVFHFAADPTAQQTWPNLVGPNLDALVNVFHASVAAGVRRVVYASSNHVLGGYKDRAEPWLLTTDLPALPGATYVVDGATRDSRPYASAKLFGERLGHCLARSRGLEVVAVRLGLMRPAANRPQDIPPEREDWFRLMWLSNRDFVHLMDRCLEAVLPEPFVIVHGMSANTGMRWDLESTKRVLGYTPVDDVMRPE